MSHALLDKAVIEMRRGEVGDVLPRLLDALRGEIASRMTTLRPAFEAGDPHTVEVQAHALKSAARSFGAMQLGELCAQMELAAKTGRPALGPDDFDRLEASAADTLKALEGVS